ncbi:hypothetical protein MFM001_23220 [Mycobacterium sp. MFM001]|nr:hypothetical protein MFM001_23220 [Mycobacterium sp. MFM001]
MKTPELDPQDPDYLYRATPVPADYPRPSRTIKEYDDPPVAFLGGATPEPAPATSAGAAITDAEAKEAATPIRVRVNKPYRVVHQGVPYTGGDRISVPNDKTTAAWLAAGWVTKVRK